MLPVTDAMVLSKYADGTLLVVAAGQTKRAELQRAAERFSQAKAAVVGIVLNEVTRQSAYGSGYGMDTATDTAPMRPMRHWSRSRQMAAQAPERDGAVTVISKHPGTRNMPGLSARQFLATYSDQPITERSSAR